MAFNCEVPSSRAGKSSSVRVVRTFEIDHLIRSSSYCAREKKRDTTKIYTVKKLKKRSKL